VRRSDDLAAIAGHYEKEMGTSLAADWQRARVSGEPDAACLRFWECAAEPLAQDGVGSWLSSCAQDDHAFTLSLDEPTWVGLESRDPSVVFGACHSDGERAAASTENERAAASTVSERTGASTENERTASELSWRLEAPGRYFLGKRDPSVALGVHLRELSSASLCEDVEPLETTFFGSFDVEVSGAELAARGAALVLRIDDVAREGTSDYAVECSDGLAASWCRGCDTFGCEPACGDHGAAFRRFSDDDIVLRLSARAGRTGSQWVKVVRADHL
jgi:hypothetical protein